jgi:hypothetical protein
MAQIQAKPLNPLKTRRTSRRDTRPGGRKGDFFCFAHNAALQNFACGTAQHLTLATAPVSKAVAGNGPKRSQGS